MSRDNNDLPAKPHPASLIDIVQNKWSISLPTRDVLMIGDSVSNDVVFGNTAGVSTVLLQYHPSDKNDTTNHEDDAIQSTSNINANEINNPNESVRKPTKIIYNLWELPRWIWNEYQILGPIGTNVPPLKYDTPQPQSKASRAAFDGDLSLLKQLPMQQLQQPDEDNQNTPLIWAVEAGHLHILDYLLSTTSTTASSTRDTQRSLSKLVTPAGYLGATAVHRAVRTPKLIDILHVLLDHLSTHQMIHIINQPNNKLQFPLHIAAFHCNHKAVELLLHYGANPLVLDRKGRTPDQDTSDRTIQQMILQARTQHNAK